ncbi:unnamed protein product [Polarella glacialis]|uniref:Methyltransferase domain-containing protein n=2 Tax=Polarella glacialis TaxID=89957 RepID=A0A813EHU8_POLGL|nr:unnamed protein product [Polarella glacialis]
MALCVAPDKTREEGETETDTRSFPPPPTAAPGSQRTRNNRLIHQRCNGKKNRFQDFAAFLRSRTSPDSGGAEALNAGLGVLDVAGGKGQLALELAVNGICATVLDPALFPLSEFKSKELLTHCCRLAADLRPTPDDTAQRERRRLYGSISVWIHPSILSDAGRAPQIKDLLLAEHAVPLYIHRRLFDESFVGGSCAESARLWSECSVVLGLHPDQATEPLVRHCLAAKKPFAVMPCCVFPNENPHRLTATGKPVRSLDEFIEYLLGLDTSGQMIKEDLDSIPGCNTVLHYRLEHVGKSAHDGA